MRKLSSCHICHRPAISIFATPKWAHNKEFCSENCKKAYFGTFYAATGIIIMGFSALSLLFVASVISLFFLLLGIAIMPYGF